MPGAGERGGICDRCGFRYYLDDLGYEYEDQRLNGLRICTECLDVDHPQLELGEFIITDPEALYDPRPDLNRLASISFFGWMPIGHSQTGEITTTTGTLGVRIDEDA